jgi:hypothetical protein
LDGIILKTEWFRLLPKVPEAVEHPLLEDHIVSKQVVVPVGLSLKAGEANECVFVTVTEDKVYNVQCPDLHLCFHEGGWHPA